jgi:hypothetical protein
MVGRLMAVQMLQTEVTIRQSQCDRCDMFNIQLASGWWLQRHVWVLVLVSEYLNSHSTNCQHQMQESEGGPKPAQASPALVLLSTCTQHKCLGLN